VQNVYVLALKAQDLSPAKLAPGSKQDGQFPMIRRLLYCDGQFGDRQGGPLTGALRRGTSNSARRSTDYLVIHSSSKYRRQKSVGTRSRRWVFVTECGEPLANLRGRDISQV
jgi:hypothetical protein